MSIRSVLPSCVVVLLAILPALAGGSVVQQEVPDPVCPQTPPIDHVCVENPVFPPDCVTQMGAIGGPPLASSDEGFLHIASPVVDPVLRLNSGDVTSDRLYALNPLNNSVRVWEQDFVADIPVCYRPSALAQSADGSQVYVSCHASHAVGVIDTATNLMVATIQDRDDLGRPRLQEPMGIAVVGGTLYVASSQSHQIAVIDVAMRRVTSYIDIPGQDPRTLTLAGDYLIVANLLAGNRSEPERPDRALANMPETCQTLLQDPGALAVFDETSPTFMDTSHPDYDLIAECYFSEHITGGTQLVVTNPDRPDHDLVVVRRSDGQVVFTTDVLATDVGTLNYDVAYEPGTSRVYLATVHARNALNAGFGKRPLINRLVVLDLDPATGALTLPAAGIKDLDAPFLDECDDGAAQVATPYAIAVDAQRVLVAAAGSDRLAVFNPAGELQHTIPVGFGPKGVALAGNTAWVYNSTGLDVSRVDLAAQTSSVDSSIGPNGLPQLERIGMRLWNSAEFASNGTFACASCHPEGHLDGLVWRLNDTDGLRATMTVQEISETAAYHWDGSKCNQVKILQDGITNLFGGDEPTDCELQTMIEFMDNLVRPHSPYRAVDDSITPEAGLGSATFHRASMKTVVEDLLVTCNDRFQDLTVESKYLEAFADPFNPFFAFGGGGGPIPNTTDSESCSVSSCHVSPHTESDGLNNMGQLRDGFQAVSTLSTWDRNVTMHDGRMARAKYIEALDVNRQFHGETAVNPGDNFSGVVATHGFNDAFFRHPEYSFDGNPATNAWAMTDPITQFIKEEEELQASSVGLSIVLRRAELAENAALHDALETAADEGKITLLGLGTIAGALVSLEWQPGTGTYLTGGGQSLTRTQLQDALGGSDSMLLWGGLLPNQGSAPHPKFKAVGRDTSPYLCSEGYDEYQGTVATGETDVELTIHGIEVVAGSRVLVDGQPVGAPLAGAGPAFPWILPAAPQAETVLNLQILGPTGMLSNSIPLPVVDPVVPATEPQIDTALKNVLDLALVWDNQFGLTGPGTRYDVYRGTLSDLRTSGGFTGGDCQTDPPTIVFGHLDQEDPGEGEGFYFVARAQNQVNRSTWGSNLRDAEINSAPGACPPLFP